MSGETGGGYPWQRRLGASPRGDRTGFRVWAPRADSVAVVHRGRRTELRGAGFGIWEGDADIPRNGDYVYELLGRRGRSRRLPDPCSLSQPRGLRGPSRVFDAGAYEWHDRGFRAKPLADAVIYELHVGTFTDEGTFDAGAAELARLARLGITAVELMPVAEGPGERGWGYDGVYISAAHHAYGGPEALQRFVDAAHQQGIAVILDVVYNHLGASGVRAMESFGPYFTERYQTFWGKAINYDDECCDAVREWVLQSAERWVRDFHVDGLRLDAIHAIFDQSAKHIVAEIVERVAAVDRPARVIAESGLNDPVVIRPPSRGGWGCDAQWADDFHHSLRALLTNDREAYYADFGSVGDLAKAMHRPFVHDGQYSGFRRRRFGAPAEDRPPRQFVVFSQNHDQVGNRALGDRLPGRARRLAAFCVLLSPFVPMLFMGEEYGEPNPFQFFTDHIDKRIAEATRKGRREEFSSFSGFSAQEIPDPQSPATFEASRLSRRRNKRLEALYAELLRVRGAVAGEAELLGLDEQGRWLRLRRGRHQMICNFSTRTRTFAVTGARVVLATSPAARRGRELRVAPVSGVLLE
ncbi:MAG TPA: malto-oligosyltrehalose trehalohydrolase [Solirubrobacteraceae bacterium]|nr:malto-oligosyltrehalose trehalohydrolase [Solirubrobacteraceae bacterium]